MVEIVIRSNVIGYFVALHIKDLGSRNLISVFNRALALLLVHDRSVNNLLNCTWLGGRLLIFVSLISVLVASYEWKLQKLKKVEVL